MIGWKLNFNGRLAKIGDSGKYYCADACRCECGGCNGFCGPNDGCNCDACQALDKETQPIPGAAIKLSYTSTTFLSNIILFVNKLSLEVQSCLFAYLAILLR